MVVVVSDTSPMRALEFLGEMPVLKLLFDEVLVPPAVRDELRSPRYQNVDLSQYDFIEVRSPTVVSQVQQFLRELDRGESEALALALESGSQLILMDEKAGRNVASAHGIVPLGTLGVLLRAKRRGYYSEIRPFIEKLDELKFFMTPTLKNNVLRLAGE